MLLLLLLLLQLLLLLLLLPLLLLMIPLLMLLLILFKYGKLLSSIIFHEIIMLHQTGIHKDHTLRFRN